MVKTSELQKLQIGDVIISKKPLYPLYKHFFIFAGKDEKGNQIIAENQLGYGVRYVYLQSMIDSGTEIMEIRSNNYSDESKRIIQNRIDEKKGRGYNLFNYNCEHFVNEVIKGIPVSHQVDRAIANTSTIGLFLLGIFFIHKATSY